MKKMEKNTTKHKEKEIKDLEKKEKFIEDAMKDFKKLQNEILPFTRKETYSFEAPIGEWKDCSISFTC
jgi:cell division protein FtsB